MPAGVPGEEMLVKRLKILMKKTKNVGTVMMWDGWKIKNIHLDGLW
jgi:hypothetical protein